MHARFSWLLAALPLAAAAQRPVATHPAIDYVVGLHRAPLFHTLPDTLRAPGRYLSSQATASVVGQYSPRWVAVRLDGFLYFTPANLLLDYDPADATPPPLDATTQRITYSAVVPAPGASQAELYARARAWIATAYPQQNARLTREDPASGQLQLQGTQLVQLRTVYEGIPRGTYAGVVHHSLSIYVKDGRFKYIFSDFVHDAQNSPNLRSGGALEQERAHLFGYAGLGSQKPWQDLKAQALRDARRLAASLQAALAPQSAPASSQPAPAKPRPDPSDF